MQLISKDFQYYFIKLYTTVMQIFKNNINNEIFTINNVILANTMMLRGQQLTQINMDKIKIK